MSGLDRPTPPRATPAAFAPRLSASWLAAQGRLPLAFMALGLVWLVIATAMLVAHPTALLLAHAAPPVIAMTHAWVLGFFVTIATGASYQIAPVALATTLRSERLGWWHFGLHAIAVPGIVYAFWTWNMPLVGIFAAAFALGIVLFAVNTWQTVGHSGQRDAVAWSLALAAGWLLLTVLAGALLSANRHWNFIPLDPLALLRAHAHLGLVGFFVTLLQGVTFRLVPMFTLADVPDWRSIRIGLWLSQLGLVVLAPALAWHHGYIAAAAGAAILLGIGSTGRALRRSLATRKKRIIDPGVAAFLRGFALLGGSALLGVVLVLPGTPWSSAPGGFNAMVYAIIVFAGGLLPAVAGMLCKIVPFLTWMRAYGPKVGRMPTPAAGALAKPRLEKWGLWLQGVAALPLAIGAWRLSPALVTTGAAVLALGVALFTADMIAVFNHLRPTAAATPSAKPNSR